ncbi:hypothetical protein D3874_21915 [Oleomonas cavernae]|uniref:Uncharacterized protein n=1 Tax=Oleomonas cavernae TaxID=2320859 RepID=A0A418WH30_9PROT|nr:hypothetical protein D3874_21915 [Oleomonas cavernae]
MNGRDRAFADYFLLLGTFAFRARDIPPPRQACIDNDGKIPGLRRLIDAVHAHGVTVDDAGQRIVSRELSIPPPLTIRTGFPVRVIGTRDLIIDRHGGAP